MDKQVVTSERVQLQYTNPVPGGVSGLVEGVSGTVSAAELPLLTHCSQHTQPISGFSQPQFAFGGQGLPVLDGEGVALSAADLSNASFQHQLQLGGATTYVSQLSFPASAQQEQDVKYSKKTATGMTAAGLQIQGDMQTPGIPVVDLDSETGSNCDMPLTLACAEGHEELVMFQLSRGADIERRDKKGFTPLILAATAGHDKVVEILLNHGADIEAQSERTMDNPLGLACSGGRYGVVEILLSRGANKEHRNVSDYTPLSLAASGGYTNIIKLLLTHGAEINSRTGSKLGISPLMLAAMNSHTPAVKLLLDMGSDINAQTETNRKTALTLACFQGRHEVVSLLLDWKANVEHMATTGLTPLMEAARGGYTEIGRVLLNKGADINASSVLSSGDTALTISADKGHYSFVELLLSRGAQVDVRNKKGNSSLRLAANGGHLDVVQLLHSAGADIDCQMSKDEIGPQRVTGISATSQNFSEDVTPEYKIKMEDVMCKTAFESDESDMETIAFESESEDIVLKSESEGEIAFESGSEMEASESEDIVFESESEVEGYMASNQDCYCPYVCPFKMLHTEKQPETKDNSVDAEWNPVNSCCPQNCLNSVDEKTFSDLKLEFKKDIKLETKRHLLIHFRKQCDFGLGLKVFHWKKQTICFKAFSEKTGISTYLIQCVRKDQMNGTVRYVHGNKSTIKTSSASIKCISFLISYGEIFGQSAPDEETIVIPSHIKIKEVYKAYTEQIMEPHIGLSTFYQLLENRFGPNRYDRSLPHIRFSEYSTHSRCNTCVVLDKLQRSVKKEEELKYVQALKFKHRQRFGQARQTIANLVQLAITFPDNNLYIKLDDMDNSKSYIPHAEEPGKALSNLFRLPTKITGTITISSRYPSNRSVDFFLNHSQFENGSNKVVTILYKLLENHVKKYEMLPSNLHLNLDNCAKENKNKFLFAFLAVLVLFDIFQEITVNYMLVGHTGNDVDQLFSVLAPEFKSEISTLEDLHNLITESSIVPKPTSQNLEYIHDWKSFISPFLKPLSQHSFFHSFQIKKENGDVKFRAKKYPQDPEYFPLTGISLLKDNIDLQPVPAADFRVETLELDRVFRDLNKYIEQQPPPERVKIRESWDNLRENLEKMPRRQKFLPKLDILKLPKQTPNSNLLLSHHLLPPIDDEDLPELRGEEFPAELNIGDFEREVLVKMDVVLYTKSVKSRPWVGRVIELLPDGKFLLQWYSRKSRGNTFYAMQNNGEPYTAIQSATMVMFWEMSDNKTKDSFQLSKRWMDKIMAEYKAIDETE